MPKLDLDAIPQTNTTGYPAPYDEAVAGRLVRRLRPAAGLTELGAAMSCSSPAPGRRSATGTSEEDELVVILRARRCWSRTAARQCMRPGDVAAWPKGVHNGHCLQNRGDADCVMLAVSAGDTRQRHGEYPDIDLKFSRPTAYCTRTARPILPKGMNRAGRRQAGFSNFCDHPFLGLGRLDPCCIQSCSHTACM